MLPDLLGTAFSGLHVLMKSGNAKLTICMSIADSWKVDVPTVGFASTSATTNRINAKEVGLQSRNGRMAH